MEGGGWGKKLIKTTVGLSCVIRDSKRLSDGETHIVECETCQPISTVASDWGDWGDWCPCSKEKNTPPFGDERDQRESPGQSINQSINQSLQYLLNTLSSACLAVHSFYQRWYQ